MATLTVINEAGERERREVVSREATITDGDEIILAPAVPQRIEWDHEGQMSSITTNCGETENRRESDERPSLTIEGILVESQIRDAQTLQQGDEITLVSDLYKGPVTVHRVTIEQNTDIISFDPNNGPEELAFPFQIQFRDPGSNGG